MCFVVAKANRMSLYIKNTNPPLYLLSPLPLPLEFLSLRERFPQQIIFFQRSTHTLAITLKNIYTLYYCSPFPKVGDFYLTALRSERKGHLHSIFAFIYTYRTTKKRVDNCFNIFCQCNNHLVFNDRD